MKLSGGVGNAEVLATVNKTVTKNLFFETAYIICDGNLPSQKRINSNGAVLPSICDGLHHTVAKSQKKNPLLFLLPLDPPPQIPNFTPKFPKRATRKTAVVRRRRLRQQEWCSGDDSLSLYVCSLSLGLCIYMYIDECLISVYIYIYAMYINLYKYI